jgi:O-antigen ligase
MKLGLSQNKILDQFAFLFFLSLPFPRNFSTIAIVFILLFSFWRLIKSKSLPDIKWNWFLPLLFLYYVISNLLSGGSWSSMEKRLLFVVIPILFWLNPGFYKAGLRPKFYLGYIFGVLLSEFICLIVAIRRSVSFVDGNWVFNPKVFPNADYDFLTASVRDGNYFFGEEFSYFLHPIYFGLYIVFAQFLIFEVFKNARKLSVRGILFTLYLAQFALLFLVSSKAAIISSLLLAFYSALAYPQQIRVKCLIALGLIIFTFAFVSFNPKMRVFKDNFVEQLSINPNAQFGHDLRILSWDASLTIIKKNWLAGVGEGHKDTILTGTYVEKKYVIPAQEGFNSHNQYLDFLLGGGVIALSIYLWGILWMVYKAVRSDNRVLLIFVLLFSFEAFFENLLSRHAGVLLFSVFIVYLGGLNVSPKDELRNA